MLLVAADVAAGSLAASSSSSHVFRLYYYGIGGHGDSSSRISSREPVKSRELHLSNPKSSLGNKVTNTMPDHVVTCCHAGRVYLQMLPSSPTLTSIAQMRAAPNASQWPREDVRCCLPPLQTGRPVDVLYSTIPNPAFAPLWQFSPRQPLPFFPFGAECPISSFGSRKQSKRVEGGGKST